MADVEPTAPGHVWVCGSCPFKAQEILEAREHVAEIETAYRAGEKPSPHACYEALGGDRTKHSNVRRWIYTVPMTGELRLGDYAEYRAQSDLYGRKKRGKAT